LHDLGHHAITHSNTRQATAADPLLGPGWASGVEVPTAGSYGALGGIIAQSPDRRIRGSDGS